MLQYLQYIEHRCDVAIPAVHWTSLWCCNTCSTLNIAVMLQYLQYIEHRCNVAVLQREILWPTVRWIPAVHKTSVWYCNTCGTLNMAVMLRYCSASGCALQYIEHCYDVAVLQREMLWPAVHRTSLWCCNTCSTLNIAVMSQYCSAKYCDLQYVEHCCYIALLLVVVIVVVFVVVVVVVVVLRNNKSPSVQ